MSPKISGCLIVKNEEQYLQQCLQSLAPWVDELILVDTGSTDNTIEISKQFTSKIFHFDWCDDFAAARNFSLAQATGEWILTLDADETLSIQDSQWTRQLPLASDIWALSISLYASSDDMTAMNAQRLFRNSSRLRYQGRYHEHLTLDHQPLSPTQVQQISGLSITHYGYNPEILPQKSQIRIPILENIHQTEGLDLMLLWTLSGMYECIGDLEKAENCYTEAAERLLPALLENEKPKDFRAVPSWLFGLGAKYFKSEEFESVNLICQRGLEWCPDFPPLLFLSGLLMKWMGLKLAAKSYFQACLELDQNQAFSKAEPFDIQFIQSKPQFELGLLALEEKNPSLATIHFRQCLEFAPNHQAAKIRLEQLINHHQKSEK